MARPRRRQGALDPKARRTTRRNGDNLGKAVAAVAVIGVILAFMRNRAAGPCRTRMEAPPGSLGGRTAIVTGANSGIGVETARGLARLGAHVVLACRTVAKGEATIAALDRDDPGLAKNMSALALDLSSLASVRAFAAAFARDADADGGDAPRGPRRLDVLAMNAGVMGVPQARRTSDGFESHMGINHLGHFLLALKLLPHLQAGARATGDARVVTVSSDFHHFGELDLADLMKDRPGAYTPLKGYCASKLANVLFAAELQRRLDGAAGGAGAGVTSTSLHPGGIITGITRNWFPSWLNPAIRVLCLPFLKTLEEGAATTVHAAAAPSLKGVGGVFLADCGATPPSAAAQDAGLARELWAASEKLTGGAITVVDGRFV